MSILQENKKRENYIDIAKALGIILVVLGHTDFVGKNIIYQFHLPLFFFLSGIVFNVEKAKKTKEFLLKRIMGLYIPFVVFELLFTCIHNVLVDINFYTELSNVRLNYDAKYFFNMVLKILTLGGGEQLVGPLWFLISTFEINIIFAVLARISQKYEKNFPFVLLLLCFILFFVGCYTDLPRMLSQSLIGMFFYCCGYIFKRYKEKVPFNIKGIIISLILLIVCSIYNKVDISQLDITYKVLLIISGLSGSYIVIWISKKFKILQNTFMLYCGMNTIYILALHCVFFKFIMLLEIMLFDKNMNLLGMFPVYQYSQIWVIPLTIIGVLGPMLIKLIVDKVKYYLPTSNKENA